MADKPFDRVVAYDLAVLKHEHLNRAYSQLDMTTRELLRQQFMGRSGNIDPTSFSADGVNRSGFVGTGFRPVWVSGMSVRLTAGQGFQYDATTSTDINGVTGLDDLSSFKPLVLTANVDIAVPAADPTNPRIDLIEVKYNGRRADSESLVYLSDPTNGVLSSASYLMTLTYGLSSADVGYVVSPSDSTASIGYKQGTAAGSPTAPTPTAGYEVVGYVYVPAAAATLAQGYIYDERKLLNPGRVRISLTKAGGVGGNFDLADGAIDAPPGVEVRVVVGAGSQCNYTIFVFCSNAAAAAALMATPRLLPVAVASCPSSFSAAETVETYAVATAHPLTAGEVTSLADVAQSFPSTLVTRRDRTRYCYRIAVFHRRNDGATVDFNVSQDMFDSVEFTIPIV